MIFQSRCNIERIIHFFSPLCAEILAVIKVKVLCNVFCSSNEVETVFICIFGHSSKVSAIGCVLTDILKLQSLRLRRAAGNLKPTALSLCFQAPPCREDCHD